MQGVVAKKVFITRPAPPESVIRQRLEPKGFEVTGQSLVEFTAVPFVLPPAFDWVFFYSGQGVRFFFEGLAKSGTVLPETVRFAAMGPGTARLLEKTDFAGDGVPETTAAAFAEIAAGQRVVFPHATNSRQSVQHILKNVVKLLDLVVYQNTPLAEIPVSDAEALVFTSPLNTQAYFSKHALRAGQKVLAIGATTARALLELNIEPHAVAQQPSEEALAQLILELL